MPITSFSSINNFFSEKSYDNVGTAPPGTYGAARERYTSIAKDSANTEARNLVSRPVSYATDARNAARDVAGGNATSAFDKSKMRLPYAGNLGGSSREGFILTSDQWIAENKALVLHAGPNSVSWNMALRAQDEENKAGHARYAQARFGKDSATPVFFDFPKLTFQFQSGNIMPIPGFMNEHSMAHGHKDFYHFFELMNQPPIIASGEKEGKHNYTWIFYTSLQFPKLVLQGYFEPEGVSWEDTAEAATAINWNASFIAHEMTPNLWEYSELEDAYREYMRSNVKLF